MSKKIELASDINVFEHCTKCTICTAYCPVSRAFYNYPGPKVLGPDGERFRRRNPHFLDSNIVYCTNCKTCEEVCPSQVNISELIQEARWRQFKRRPPSIRDYIMSHTDLVGFFATKFAFLVNLMLKMKIIRWIMDILIRVERKTVFPTYSQGTFRGFWKRHYCKEFKPEKAKSKILYFHGCYINYQYHGLGKDFLTILKHNNIEAEIPKQKCCGVPLIANGNHKKAKSVAKYNLKSFEQYDASLPVISTSSSCYRAFQDEYAGLLKLDNQALASHFYYVSHYLLRLKEEGSLNLNLHPLNLKVLYHAPCHLRTKGDYLYSLELLDLIPELQVIQLDFNCCGIAGTYGFKKEKYPIAKEIGKPLFDQIQSYEADYIVTDCETCKMQIEMNTNATVIHPITLLAQSYALNESG